MSQELVDAAALTFRFVLAFLFLAAAVPKLSARREFERAVANYALLPQSLVGPVAAWLPRLELLCALALLLGVAVTPVAIATGSLLVVFAIAVAINLARGREIDCGCQGSVAPRQIGWSLVGGDLVLAGIAVAVALANPDVLALDASRAASASSLSSQDGVALLLIAGVLVLTHMLVSAWLELRSPVPSLRTRLGEGSA